MSKLDDQVSAIDTSIEGLKTDLTAAIDRVAVDVTELQAQIANGQAIPDSAFDALQAKLAAMRTQVQGVDPLPDFPAPPPAA